MVDNIQVNPGNFVNFGNETFVLQGKNQRKTPKFFCNSNLRVQELAKTAHAEGLKGQDDEKESSNDPFRHNERKQTANDLENVRENTNHKIEPEQVLDQRNVAGNNKNYFILYKYIKFSVAALAYCDFNGIVISNSDVNNTDETVFD